MDTTKYNSNYFLGVPKMSINVEAFKSKLVGGGARSNLFKVEIQAPLGLGSTNDFEFFCRAAQLPGASLAVVEVAHQGRVVKLYGNRTFEDWTITVYNDENFRFRDLFFKWSNRINGLESNLTQQTETGPLSYKGSATITQLAKNGDSIRSYRLIGCFPSVINPIDVDWDAKTTIQDFQVTLAYDYWVPSQTTAPGIGVNISDASFSATVIR